MTNGDLLLLAGLGGAGLLAVLASRRSTPASLPAPTGLTASTVSATGLTLTWDSVTGAAEYVPYQDGTALPAQALLSLTLANLTPLTTYQFAVAANGGLRSAAISVTTLSGTVTPPQPPTGLAASNIGATGFDGTWTADPTATAYTPYLDGVALPATTALSVAITGLLEGSVHTLAVDAFNSGGHSAPCAPITVTTKAAAPPTPTGLAASNITDTSVDLDCNPAPGATSYIFMQDGVALAPVSTPSVTVTGLTPGHKYTFKVAAADAGGQSVASPTITVNTAAMPKPPPPVTNLTPSAITTTGFTLTWTGSASAIDYIPFVDGTAQAAVTSTQVVISGLPATGKRLINVAVQAENAAGTSKKTSTTVTLL